MDLILSPGKGIFVPIKKSEFRFHVVLYTGNSGNGENYKKDKQ